MAWALFGQHWTRRAVSERKVHAEAANADNLISFAMPGFPLCGSGRPWQCSLMSDTWRGVTCKRCLAMKKEKRRGK